MTLPVSVLKQFANRYCEKLINIFNNCLKENRFPNSMKVAKISPLSKKLDNTSKDNHRLISTLSNIAKLFKNTTYLQLNHYMENKFSNTSLAIVKIITHKTPF